MCSCEDSFIVLGEKDGLHVVINPVGARVSQLWVPDSTGKLVNVVLGAGESQWYANAHEKYYGATVGRWANRLAKGRFFLHDQIWQVTCNDGMNHLHGGVSGFHVQRWNVVTITADECVLQHVSPHLNEGFPGEVVVQATFSIVENAFNVRYEAITDCDTLFGMTFHPFFNLCGEGTDNLADHCLQIAAHQYLPVDGEMIPVGDVLPVTNTPFDFLQSRNIAGNLLQFELPLSKTRGYDHAFVLDEAQKNMDLPVAVLKCIRNGVTMHVYSNQPALQIYTGNFLNGMDKNMQGKPYVKHCAVCIEPQNFPDAVHLSGAPDAILTPGMTYVWHSAFVFTAD